MPLGCMVLVRAAPLKVAYIKIIIWIKMYVEYIVQVMFYCSAHNNVHVPINKKHSYDYVIIGKDQNVVQ